MSPSTLYLHGRRGTALTVANILDEVKEDEMGSACGTHGRTEGKYCQCLGLRT